MARTAAGIAAWVLRDPPADDCAAVTSLAVLLRANGDVARTRAGTALGVGGCWSPPCGSRALPEDSHDDNDPEDEGLYVCRSMPDGTALMGGIWLVLAGDAFTLPHAAGTYLAVLAWLGTSKGVRGEEALAERGLPTCTLEDERARRGPSTGAVINEDTCGGEAADLAVAGLMAAAVT